MTISARKPSIVHVIDDDDRSMQQLTSLLLDKGIGGRRFPSLVPFLQWLDYDCVGDGTVIAAAIDLADINGFEFLNILHADEVFIPTVLMGQTMSVSQAVEAMHAGAGYILKKPFSDSDFCKALERALDTTSYTLRETIDSQVRRRYSSLSKRQREMLVHVFEGRTNNEIADRLEISPKTVELHRSAMMNKMGAGTLAELIRVVASCGNLISRDVSRDCA